MKTHFFIALISGLILAACQGDDKEGSFKAPPSTEKNQPQEEVTEKDKEVPFGFELKAVAMDLPNHYQVHLSWEDLVEIPSAWTLYKNQAESSLLVPIAALKGEQRSFVDNDVIAGKAYRYSIGFNDFSKVLILGEKTIIVPKDFVVAEKTRAQSIKGFNRLFLFSSARLIADVFDFTIDVNEIITDGAVIESFSNTYGALPGEPGRSGGTIKILAKRATGELTILAKGQAGGTGITGKQGKAGAKGKKGADGECGHKTDQRLCSVTQRKFELITKAYLSRVGVSPYFCKKQTEEGGQGLMGGTGEVGGEGGKGGASSLVFVRIKNATDSKINVETHPGPGGDTGLGGPGGVGGSGGQPGKRDRFGLCRVAGVGLRGETGLRGPSGKAGQAGKIGSVCLKLGETSKGDCGPFEKDSANL